VQYYRIHIAIHLIAILDVDESKVMAAAKSFVSLGLKDAGYEYVNIDVSSLFLRTID
jgi:hypothetical protein